MDLNRLMRPLLPIAVIALAASCSTGGGEGDQDASESPGGESATGTSLADVTEPVVLEIEPPEGFVVDDALERTVGMSDAANTYAFSLEGGSGYLMVSTYVLETPIDDEADYAGAVAAIREYNAQVGHEYVAENERRSIVHRHSGVSMLTGWEESGAGVIEQSHYFFEAAHAIQITCHWTDPGYVATYAGCQSLLEEFPFPDGWTP
jgi:hypothetical protein